MLSTASFGTARGSVTAFDATAGLGEITGDDGRLYPFHCTAIADGSRDIELGKQVAFTIVAGHLGRFEATAIS